MIKDLRHAFRRLLKSPGFTIIAVLTLALGLGANITVFSMIEEFMMRPLSVPRAGELVFVMQKAEIFPLPLGYSYPDYLDMTASLAADREAGASTGKVFSGLVAESLRPVLLGQTGEMPERMWAAAVSPNYFDALEVRPARGRLFLPGEGVSSGADPIVVLSHQFWTEHFGADPHIVGQSVMINGSPFTVVGVAGRQFGGTQAMVQAHMFVPATMWDALHPGDSGDLERRSDPSFLLMGRLLPGTSREQALAATKTVVKRLIADYPNDHGPTKVRIISEQLSRPSPHVSDFAPLALAALMALALLVLAVAAANIANLLYARVAQAERTIAIRSSLGASRWQLIRFLLSESVLIAIAAGALGWIASDLFGRVLSTIAISADNPPTTELPASWMPLAFTLGAALLTGLVTGIFPALRATRRDMLPLLNESTRSVSGGRHALRSLLVCGQVALSSVVLVCAGLAAHSLFRLGRIDLGYRTDKVLIASFDLELLHYDRDQATQFQERLLDEVRALPGVETAAISRTAPFDRSIALRGGLAAEGQPPPEENDPFVVAEAAATPGWLETIRMPLLSGRTIGELDTKDTQQVAVVNEVLARHFWPGDDPIGKRLVNPDGPAIEVIGLVGHARYFMMGDVDRPFLFRPLKQRRTTDFTIALRTTGDPRLLAQPLIQVVRRLDPNVPVQNLRTLEEQVAQSPLGLMPLRLGAAIATTQGALVLVLAIMGLYGLVSFAVTNRTREIGIRMALGATRQDILRLVTRPSLVLTGIGLVIGLALAFVISRPMIALLYGASPSDLLVFGGVSALIAAVTLVSAWLPAQRAIRVNPTEALRAE